MAPVVALAAISVPVFKQYRVQMWLGWTIFIIAMGCFTMIKADTAKAVSIGLSVPISIGGGLVYGMFELEYSLRVCVSDFRNRNHLLPRHVTSTCLRECTCVGVLRILPFFRRGACFPTSTLTLLTLRLL